MGAEAPTRYMFRASPRVDALVAYVRRMVAETGNTPSYSMIRDALGFYDNGTIRRAVRAAEAKGLLTLGEYTGGRGPRCGQRIRLGRPEEADTVKIKMGRDL
ncbi:hypothetical protein HD841_000535 [Sphingomonas melonis]|uniref:LexA repressor DNA-binding domain-containing protein n=2 Tax=Sphingomonas melonis TaxID=152682 RepID=A0A7Y9FK17_9SPHN|nr:hypothetical protein [Sphingomonas melonis]